MRRVCLALVLGLAGAVWAQGADPEAARARNDELQKGLDSLGATGERMAERLKTAQRVLDRALQDLARLVADYAEGVRLPREDVLLRLGKLEDQTKAALLAADLAPLERTEDQVNARLEDAGNRLVTIEKDFARWRKEAPSEEWDAIQLRADDLLRKTRSLASDVAGQISDVKHRRYELLTARRKMLFLLRRENLFIRNEPILTSESIAQGLRDARELPGWVSGNIAAYENGSALLPFLAAVVAAAFLLLLLRRRMPVLTSLATVLILFLLPYLASIMLPGLGAGFREWLRLLGYVLGGLWLVVAFRTRLLPRLDVDPWVAQRLRMGAHLVFWISIAFLPLLLALERLGYENEGPKELLRVVYELLMAATLLAFVLRRRVVAALLPGTDTPGGRALRLVARILRPALILAVPAVLVLDALQFDLLAGVLGRLVVSVLAVVVLSALVYRVARLGITKVMSEGPARDGSLFLLKVASFFAALWAVLTLSDADFGTLRGFFDAPLPLLHGGVTWWNLIAAGVLLFLFLAATKHFKRWLQDVVLARTRLDSGTQYTITTLSGYVFVTLGLYLSLREVFDFSTLGYVLAALSVGIGFGLQEIVSNFVSGLILLFERPLNVGDLVQVGDVDGVVRHISIRATTVQTRDNVHLLVPNRIFITETVTNYAYRDPRIRIHVGVGVSYGSDVELVKKTLLEVADGSDKVLKVPVPEAWFVDFGDSSLDFELLAWVSKPADRWRIASQLRFAMFAAFAEHGIQIPFPQRDLHLRSAEPLRVERD